MFSILLMYLPNHPSLAERNILSLVYLNLYWIEQRNNLYDSNGINFSFFCLLLPSNKNISDLELDRALKDVVRISQNGKREILNGHKLDDRKKQVWSWKSNSYMMMMMYPPSKCFYRPRCRCCNPNAFPNAWARPYKEYFEHNFTLPWTDTSYKEIFSVNLRSKYSLILSSLIGCSKYFSQSECLKTSVA